MTVTTEKLGDAVPVTVPGTGMNDGGGALSFIAGMPTHRVEGAVIRLTGGVLRCVTVERDRLPVIGLPVTVVTRYMTDGSMVRHVSCRRFETVRLALLRRAVEGGIYAGATRLR